MDGSSGELGLAVEEREEEEKEKNCGGNRWPRDETLALLKIRSDLDSVFRDSNLKAPLWDQVSRKLGEFGYNRSAKKCKEKFENVYKYHKRTKEVRTGNSEQKNKKVYRFFEELEALNNHHISFQSTTIPHKKISSTTVPSLTNPTKTPQNININSPKNPLSNLPNMAANVIFSSSTSSSTASDDDPLRPRRKSKRKWSDFFVKLTKEVIEKQEGLQMKFLEAMERIENQRKLRDESWRMKEMSRVHKEHEIFVQERSMAAAKDAAVVSLLQKITPPQSNYTASFAAKDGIISSSRWPKAEVEELIRLRTELEVKYNENGPKGALWEEISAAMRKLGHNRNAKRCKEKWENINKYFKKVKESNKMRPEDSKTCPYFHQLDALYRQKEKISFDINNQMEPLMVEPEQQWPPPFHQIMNIGEQNQEHEENGANSSEDEEDEEDGGSSFEMATNKTSPITISNTV